MREMIPITESRTLPPVIITTRAIATSYSWNGGYYKKWLAKQDVEINDKIWDRVSVGNITLKHDKVNYVNGQDEKDSDENENRKK